MNPKQLLKEVIRPTLQKMGAHSLAAERLVLGTIYKESHGVYLRQLGHGPALGIIQMEPATYHDIWRNFLRYRSDLTERIVVLASVDSISENAVPHPRELITNLSFAVAMCRAHYMRVSEPLPHASDIAALASYWKRYYNTRHGAGTAQEFVDNFPREIIEDCV